MPSVFLQYTALELAVAECGAMRDKAPTGTKDLAQLVLRERGLGFHVIGAGSATDLGSNWEDLPKAFKGLQTGFVLGSSDQPDLQVLNLNMRMLPNNESGMPLPPGQ